MEVDLQVVLRIRPHGFGRGLGCLGVVDVVMQILLWTQEGEVPGLGRSVEWRRRPVWCESSHERLDGHFTWVPDWEEGRGDGTGPSSGEPRGLTYRRHPRWDDAGEVFGRCGRRRVVGGSGGKE